MIEQIDAATSEALARLASASTLDDLRALEPEVVGKRSPLASLKQQLGSLDPEARRAAGQALNQARQRVDDALAERLATFESAARRAQLEAERLDLTEVHAERGRGHLHLVTQTMDRLEDVFVGMGFQVAEGPEAEGDWFAFEALNMPPEHPARSGFDTLYLQLGDGQNVLLRPHTSPVQIRVMQEQKPPIYAVMPGRVFRRDTPDASHMPVFHQIEGLVVDKGISFADLAGTLEEFTTAYFGAAIHSRLRPSYFPFTEPSAEYDINCVFCAGAGCRSCGGTGWLELGGCGMVHPNVLTAVGIDPEEWTGFAFGFGIDRMTAQRHGVDDLRDLFNNDIRFLEQF